MGTSSMHAELLVAAAKSGSIELWQAVVNDTREGKVTWAYRRKSFRLVT